MVFYGIPREPLAAAAAGAEQPVLVRPLAAAERLLESMHGRHVGSACAARGSTGANPPDPAAAAQPPGRWRAHPRSLEPPFSVFAARSDVVLAKRSLRTLFDTGWYRLVQVDTHLIHI